MNDYIGLLFRSILLFWIIFNYIWHAIIVFNDKIHNLWKFGEDMLQTCIVVFKEPCMLQSLLAYIKIYQLNKHIICKSWERIQYLKKDVYCVKKIKGWFIISSHICHVKISKCVYWLDTNSMKLWGRYTISNTNILYLYF